MLMSPDLRFRVSLRLILCTALSTDFAQLLHISDEERRYIENADVGSGLLIADKAVVPFHNAFPKNTELFRLMDTNPESKP